jgi:S-DNA-T family DNA segregation ATPase FtsK/SpoIIIE
VAGVVDQDLRRGPLAPEEAVRSVLPIVRSGRNALWCAAAGLSGFGGLSLAGHPQWAWSAAVAGATAAAGAAGRGRRQMERQVLAIGIIGGLSPLLGVRELDAQTVVLSRWTRGRSSVPGRVELRYYPGIETGGSWRKEVIRVLEAKTGYPYVLGRDWPRRRRIRLVLDRSPEATKPQPAAQIRLTKAVTDLMGPTATTGTVTFDEAGQVTGFQVTHQASVKLAARGYRVRVERTLGTMLPGRWRAHWDLEGDSVRFELRPVLPTQLWVPASEVPGGPSRWPTIGRSPSRMPSMRTGA